jgi:hypothetical protein
MNEEPSNLGNYLKEIADEKEWGPDEFLDRLLKAIDVLGSELTESQACTLIDCLSELN